MRKITSAQKWDRILAVLALIFLVCVWLAGTFRAQADLHPFLKKALPEAAHFTPSPGGNYAAWKGSDKEELIGYVAVDSSHGYGGDLHLAVALALDGSVKGIAVVDHKETAAFFGFVLRRGVLDDLTGKKFSDPFILDQDVDSVTGATYSTQALVDATRKASRRIASRNLDYSVSPESAPKIRFGIPEAVLVGLFLFGIIGRLRCLRFKHKKTARWISMLTGLFILGFVFNKPLTLVLVNKALLGFWPQWQLHLYSYVLLAGILFITLVDNKNPYCEWFCPFGSAQECLAVIGGGKKRPPKNVHTVLRWFQRVLALGAISIALFYRNPSISSYEVFGAFFHLIGTNFHFVLLGIVLVAALFIRRPWCSYLCPLRPVTDFIRLVRNWIRNIWT
ncbi:MAG: 4Fe-4S binding protein [Candidatus Aminicenantes bacterium]|nr:MAG: 4Fe-4S binding protein [Candidatus Aminicenantes bacterium]